MSYEKTNVCENLAAQFACNSIIAIIIVSHGDWW